MIIFGTVAILAKMKIEVINPNPQQFLAYIDNFLSDVEIDNFRRKSDEEFNFAQSDVLYRNNQRGILVLPEITSTWFERCKEHLPDIGTWKLYMFDSVVKFYRYKKGEFFTWHKDQPIVGPEKSRSKSTILMYLSDGGSTEYDFKDGIVSSIEGKTGRAILFNHRILHRSPRLKVDNKVTCRLDILYKENV